MTEVYETPEVKTEPKAEPKTDYSKTLNVPKPDIKNPDGLDTNPDSIPQRANLPRREPQLLEFWKQHRVYEKSLKPRTALGTFELHDGPGRFPTVISTSVMRLISS